MRPIPYVPRLAAVAFLFSNLLVAASPAATADDVLPFSTEPATTAVDALTSAALVYADDTTTFVFLLQDITEGGLAKIVSEAPDEIVIPFSMVDGFIAAGADYVVVLIVFAADGKNTTGDAATQQAQIVSDYVEQEVNVDDDVEDGDTQACFGEACAYVRFGEPIRIEATDGADANVLVDTHCGTGDTDCDGFTTLFELMNGRNPLDPNG